MKKALLASMLWLLGCGGSSPTAPTAPSTTRLPNVLGTWTVAYSAVSAGGGTSGSSRCPGTLSITSQTGGAFSGAISITSPCADAGNVNAQIDTAGVVSTFVVSGTVAGPVPGCSTVSEPPYTGRLVSNTMTVNKRSLYRCSGVGDVTVDRTISATR